ncbi:MAG: hypothetical protein KC503_21080 [Myxococcales bacterium]|nr:hypothetical protein [Myxococcales bacterium]
MLLCLAAPALAAPETHYQDAVVGERAAGMGGAFTSLADEATGAYYNPAGIARPGSNLLQLSMSAYKLTRRSIPLVDLCGRSIDEASSGFFGFPAALGYVRPFNAGGLRHAVGFTLVVPSSEKQQSSRILRQVDCNGTPVTYAESQVLLDRLFEGGLSYALKWRRLSVGATFGLAARAVLGTSLLLAINGQSYPGVTMVNIDVTVWSLFFRVGAIIEPIDGLRFGLSLTTPHIQVTGKGRFDVAYAGSDPAAWQQTQLYAVDDVEYNARTPLALAIGASYRRGRLTLAADVKLHMPVSSYRLISRDVRLGELVDALGEIERRFVANVSVGAEYLAFGRLALRLGFFTNLSAQPAPDPQSAFDDERMQFVGFTAGGSWLSKRGSSLGLSAQLQIGTGEVSTERVTSPGGGQGLQSTYELRDASSLSLIIAFGGGFDLQ